MELRKKVSSWLGWLRLKLLAAVRKAPSTFLWGIMFFLAVAGPVGLYFWWFPCELSVTTEAWAHFGDYFGGVVGTLFVIIGSVFIYRTYTLQKDIAYQAGFENTLFRMMEFHVHLVERLQNPSDSGAPAGYTELMRLKTRFSDQHGCYIPRYISYLGEKRALIHIQACFGRLFEKEFFHIGHYFRHLYWIFRFISESNLPPVEKKKYSKIVRAQLSPDEVILLGLNGMTARGEKFRPLMTEFALLHPRQTQSDYYKVFTKFYPPGALGDHNP